MKSFATFLTEAPTPGALLFHKDIGFPQSFRSPVPGLTFTYGNHAKQSARDEGLTTLPRTLPTDFTVIETEMLRGQVLKWVVRFPSSLPHRDLVVVVVPDGFVKTVWTNDSNDKHSTLKRHLYTDPKHVQ